MEQIQTGLTNIGFTQEQIDHVIAESNIEILNEQQLLEQGFTQDVVTAIINNLT